MRATSHIAISEVAGMRREITVRNVVEGSPHHGSARRLAPPNGRDGARSGHWAAASTPPPPPHHLPPLYIGGWEGGCQGTGGWWVSSGFWLTPPHGSDPKCPFSGKGVLPYLPGDGGRYPSLPHTICIRGYGWKSEHFACMNSIFVMGSVIYPMYRRTIHPQKGHRRSLGGGDF